MARKFRVEYPGALYHVMNRGDRREPIFQDDADRVRFLETLAEAGAKTDRQAHAYCLMSNHFHLMVETPQANLVAGMQWFLGTYTSRFNRLPVRAARRQEGTNSLATSSAVVTRHWSWRAAAMVISRRNRWVRRHLLVK